MSEYCCHDEREKLREEYEKYFKKLKLDIEVIEQIREFESKYSYKPSYGASQSLTSQQESLLRQLIPDLVLRERYK
ncbi:5520_t:CDS:2 [Gigaspora margarita]|uniref:5520_t:CDS:1 n=1 Tax=Gigaspora margarita TaxID=4874 RepID=A0ABN7UCP5_GIGMA|nr:5520_t:CDS:2 [Gigaspora margarita]